MLCGTLVRKHVYRLTPSHMPTDHAAHVVLQQVHSLFQRVRAGASYFHLQSPLFSLRKSSSCLPLLLHPPATSILHSVLPSTKYCSKQFVLERWPTQLDLLLFIVGRIFLSWLNSCNTSFFTRAVKLIFSVFLQHHILNISRYFWSLWNQEYFWSSSEVSSFQYHTNLSFSFST